MAKKPFPLRLNDDMFKAIEKWAADEFRSINGQIEWMLQQMLKENHKLSKNKKDVKSENSN